MSSIIATRTNLPAGTPEDLRVFAQRMAALGVVVRLSPPLGQTTIPEPVEAEGRPLSEMILAARRGE